MKNRLHVGEQVPPMLLYEFLLLFSVYRATFPQTFREANTPPGGSMKVFIGVSVGIIIGYFLAAFLRDTGKK